MRGCGSQRLLLCPSHGRIHRTLYSRKRCEHAELVLGIVIPYPVVDFGVVRRAFENDDTDDVAADQMLGGENGVGFAVFRTIDEEHVVMRAAEVFSTQIGRPDAGRERVEEMLFETIMDCGSGR